MEAVFPVMYPIIFLVWIFRLVLWDMGFRRHVAWHMLQRRIRWQIIVYLLFLAHPEGIEFKRLGDYRQELMSYYLKTARMMDKEKIEESVDHLVNPLDNAINEKCSRIKKVFLGLMDEYRASYYFISSHTQKHIAGRVWYERLKVITLPRELVIVKSE